MMKTDNILEYHRYKASRGRSYCGSQQKAISARIDNSIMEEIENEQRATGIAKNSLINMAVAWYLQELDEARRCATSNVYTQDGSPGMKASLDRFLLSELTCGEMDKFEHIKHGFGIDTRNLLLGLVRKMLENFDKHPFLYI